MNIPDRIYNVIFGGAGVYYLITTRPEDCELFAPHIAHTILHEKQTGTRTQDRDHLQKAEDILNALQKLFDDLEDISNAIGRRYPKLSETLYDYASYIYLQLKCLSHAVNFCKETLSQSLNTPVSSPIKLASALHRVAKVGTPEAPDTVMRNARLAHEHTAKRARVDSENENENENEEDDVTASKKTTSAFELDDDDLALTVSEELCPGFVDILAASNKLKFKPI